MLVKDEWYRINVMDEWMYNQCKMSVMDGWIVGWFCSMRVKNGCMKSEARTWLFNRDGFSFRVARA